ncbi:hypothetical protein SS50377_20758 [Spironucleus salmonicida]|uniref:Transmembrane protein n=1 Tax=Spironucleus salmonicida TaxID=348837 RepID=V6LS98_9EUKA|nr:hypothetical protein SS50377_20758 [Spironucleus salmonicida]|eukprot:EST47133.1 Hypothetical protein SS50377_12842 [Spironucleus salmonicida]
MANSIIVATNEAYLKEYVNQSYTYGNVGQLNSILLNEGFTIGQLEDGLSGYSSSNISFLILPLIDCSFNNQNVHEYLQIIPDFKQFSNQNLDTDQILAFSTLVQNNFNLRSAYNETLLGSLCYSQTKLLNPDFQIISTVFNQLGQLFVENIPISSVQLSGQKFSGSEGFVSLAIGSGTQPYLGEADIMQSAMGYYFITAAIQSVFKNISIIVGQQILQEISFYTPKIFKDGQALNTITFTNLLKIMEFSPEKTFPNPNSDFLVVMGIKNMSNLTPSSTQFANRFPGMQFASQQLVIVFRCFDCNDTVEPTLEEVGATLVSQAQMKQLDGYTIFVSFTNGQREESFYVATIGSGKNEIYKTMYRTMANFNMMTPSEIQITVCKQLSIGRVMIGQCHAPPPQDFRIAVYNMGFINDIYVRMLSDTLISVNEKIYFEVIPSSTGNFSISISCTYLYQNNFILLGFSSLVKHKLRLKFLQNQGSLGICKIIVCPTEYLVNDILVPIPTDKINKSGVYSSLCGTTDSFSVEKQIVGMTFFFCFSVYGVFLVSYFAILQIVHKRQEVLTSKINQY